MNVTKADFFAEAKKTLRCIVENIGVEPMTS